jgi:flavin reductase (DIM6/NTAB) family NADH-FMN oxidoreductase RutF
MKRSLGARTLAFTTPVWVIGTYDEEGRPNAMTASWAGICCSRPPCVNVSLRKATYTFECLTHRKAFTVSVPSQKHVKEVDFLGLASGRKTEKLAVAGLTAVRSELVDAPYIAEFPLVLECKLVHSHELGLHTMFVGEILDVKADEAVLSAEGLPEVERVAPFVFGPELRVYHGVGQKLGKAFSMGHEYDDR